MWCICYIAILVDRPKQKSGECFICPLPNSVYLLIMSAKHTKKNNNKKLNSKSSQSCKERDSINKI